MDKEDPEQLLEIFENTIWDNKDDIVKDLSDKLRGFGYPTLDISEYTSDSECYINFLCEHGVICGRVWIYEYEDGGYKFDILDYDINYNDLDECPTCKKVKTVKIDNRKIVDDKDKVILDRKTVEEIIKLIESEEYLIVDDDIIISEQEGIVLTLKEILKGKNENYKAM